MKNAKLGWKMHYVIVCGRVFVEVPPGADF